MSLKHILLGLLREPASGYDLKRQFDTRVQHFWRADLAQIYPTLKQLEEEGLLASDVRPSEKGPERRVYKRTARGRRTLVDWLAAGPVGGGERLVHLAKVYFLAELDDDGRALAFMRSLREYFRGWLAPLEAVEAEWRACDPRYPDQLAASDFYTMLTLRNGLRQLASQVAWCDECIERIEQRIAAQDGADGKASAGAAPRR